jgi:uncharacterized protein YndB with AHSA1/START domain
MAVHYEYAVDLACAPVRVFALLEDVARSPEWLSRCTRIEKLDPGPNAVGMRLRYDFLQGKRPGTMVGEITAYAPHDHIAFHYTDKMFAVTIDFKLATIGAGSKLTETVDIEPRSLVGKLMQPLIRRILPKQTEGDLEKLRALVTI